MAKISGVSGIAGAGKVYSRLRRPLTGRADEYRALYADADGKVNVWMVRRAQRQPVVDEFNNEVSVTQFYQILGHYSLVDSDDGFTTASEETFQQVIEDIAAAFAADLHLGLGSGISHRGLQVPSDIQDVILGDLLVHSVEARLIVDNEEC